MADTGDLKSPPGQLGCGFESHRGHWHYLALVRIPLQFAMICAHLMKSGASRRVSKTISDKKRAAANPVLRSFAIFSRFLRLSDCGLLRICTAAKREESNGSDETRAD